MFSYSHIQSNKLVSLLGLLVVFAIVLITTHMGRPRKGNKNESKAKITYEMRREAMEDTCVDCLLSLEHNERDDDSQQEGDESRTPEHLAALLAQKNATSFVSYLQALDEMDSDWPSIVREIDFFLNNRELGLS